MQSGDLLGELRPSDSVLHSFSSSIDFPLWRNVLQQTGASVLTIGGGFTAPDSIAVFHALPMVDMRIEEGDTILSVGSRHVRATYRIDPVAGRIDIVRLVPIVYPPMSIETLIGDIPYQAAYDPERGLAFVECKKGYPAVAADPATVTPPRDPRRREFYDHAPLFWGVDLRTGEIVSEIGALDPVHWKYGLGYGISGRHVVVLDSGLYGCAQQFSSEIQLTDGAKIPLKSYFNPEVVGYDGRPGHLLTDADRDCILDSAGAYIQKLERSGNRLGVVWRIREPDLNIGESSFTFIVQEYDIASHELVAEGLIRSQKPWERIQDISFGSGGEWCALIQTARTSRLEWFGVR